MVRMCRDQIRNRVARDEPRDEFSHAGLLLASYLQEDNPPARENLLKIACNAPAKAENAYTAAFNRWRGSTPDDSVSELIEVDGRAIIGLGAESPLETGLTLHHTYGVPFIPGCALKGLASHYCHQVWGAGDSGFERGGAHFLVLFGTTEDSGHIIFNDAWISPDSLADCLDIDVMAVHHPNYYRSQQPQLPLDFEDPTPISFLSIKGRFWLTMHCDVPGDSGKEWAGMAMTLLLESLGNWGIGAKTNAGYGRMRKAGEVVRQVEAIQSNSRPEAVIEPAGRARRPNAVNPSTGTRGRSAGAGAPAGRRQIVSSPSPFPCKPGDQVEVTLSDAKTKKGGWKAVYEAGGRSWTGTIQNTGAVPADAKPGDRARAKVKFITNNDSAFDWLQGL